MESIYLAFLVREVLLRQDGLVRENGTLPRDRHNECQVTNGLSYEEEEGSNLIDCPQVLYKYLVPRSSHARRVN